MSRERIRIMWQGSYGKEPFNLRLTVLRMMKKIPAVVGITVLGTVLFGGGYYLKNVLLRGESVYEATSTYRVEYAVEEEKDVGTVYINQYSWNVYLQTEMFLELVQGHLKEMADAGGAQAVSAAEAGKLSKQELGAMLSAVLASDLRVPSTKVTCENPELAIAVGAAVEAAMRGAFAAELREVDAIEVIDSADTAEEVIPDVRVGRALILSGVLSCFFAVVFFLLKEVWEDGIWLPVTIWKRYGVRSAGYVSVCRAGMTQGSAGAAQGKAQGSVGAAQDRAQGSADAAGDGGLAWNLDYFFAEKARVAICPVTVHTDPEELLGQLKESCPETVGDGWFALPALRICPEACEKLREAEGILLAVPAGAHSGRAVEWTLEYLRQQDCEVTAAVLVNADEGLIRSYYRF